MTQTVEKVMEMYLSQTGGHTATTYKTAFSRFKRDVLAGDEPVANLDAEHLIEYRLSLTGLKHRSISTYMVPLNGLFRYVALREMAPFGLADLELAKDTIKSMAKSREDERLPQVPNEDHVQAIIRQAQDNVMLAGTDRQVLAALRDVAMLHTLRSTGIRVEELTTLRIEHVYLEDFTVLIQGKGNKQRLVIFDATTKTALADYLHEHPDGGPEAPLFLRHDKRAGDRVLPMSPNAVRDVLNSLAEEADVPPISPHKLRHRFGSMVLSQTQDLAGTQDLMGHSSPQTTRIYAKLDLARLKAIHDQVEL